VKTTTKVKLFSGVFLTKYPRQRKMAPATKSRLRSKSKRASAKVENETDYFLSHHQAASKDFALEIFYSMEKVGKKCWLDVKMRERDESAMKRGIEKCKIFLLIISPTYFTRKFCVKELEWAVEFGKPILVVIDVQHKNEIGNILNSCPRDKVYLREIGGINFNEVFRGNPDLWEASINSILKAKPKILQRDGRLISVDVKDNTFDTKFWGQIVSLTLIVFGFVCDRLVNDMNLHCGDPLQKAQQLGLFDLVWGYKITKECEVATNRVLWVMFCGLPLLSISFFYLAYKDLMQQRQKNIGLGKYINILAACRKKNRRN
jgi:hypothetical protein